MDLEHADCIHGIWKNVDITKCLGKKNTKLVETIASNTESPSRSLAYKQFSEIVAIQKVREIEDTEKTVTSQNEDHNKLYNM